MTGNEAPHRPALQAVVIDECLLDGVEFFAREQAFDSDDIFTRGIQGEHMAGINGFPVQ